MEEVREGDEARRRREAVRQPTGNPVPGEDEIVALSCVNACFRCKTLWAFKHYYTA